jgi:ribosomal protein S18 acetylase RimI-like enzyme
MATSPQTAATDALAQVEIRDLRHYSAQQLRPMLLEEAALWEERLRWEYRDSIELLLQYLDSRVLPGFAAVLHGQVIGYTFCVFEGSKAVIGDVYVARDVDPEWHLADVLLSNLIEVASASPNVDRIESQMLLYEAGELVEPFLRAGFTNFPRLYQERNLRGPSGLAPKRALPSTLEVHPWTPAAYQPAAELIQAAYAGHLDAQINDQYRTLHGSLRFLHNIIRFPGCGVFDPAASWLLRDRRSQALVGVALCSRIGSELAHITQLCVAPEYRGKGLGRTLLDHCMNRLEALHYGAITLTVSEQNEPALRLYLDAGFRTRHRFDAMVRDNHFQPYKLSR